MENKKTPVLSIVLYVVAGLLVLYTMWSIGSSYSYISELMSTGQLTFSGNEFEIIDFYMSNCSSYAIFALIIFVLGYSLQKKQNIEIMEIKHQEYVEQALEDVEQQQEDESQES